MPFDITNGYCQWKISWRTKRWIEDVTEWIRLKINEQYELLKANTDGIHVGLMFCSVPSSRKTALHDDGPDSLTDKLKLLFNRRF